MRSKRTGWIVATAIVALLASTISMPSKQLQHYSFYAFLERNPSLRSCIRPFFTLAGRQVEFDNEMQAQFFGRILREIDESSESVKESSDGSKAN